MTVMGLSDGTEQLSAADWISTYREGQAATADVYEQATRLVQDPYIAKRVREAAATTSEIGLRAIERGDLISDKKGNVSIPLSEFDWLGLAKIDRTRLWFLQQWYFVRYLCVEQQSQKLTSLPKIAPLLRSWVNSYLNKEAIAKDGSLAWHDHVTALRCFHLIAYLYLLVVNRADLRVEFPRLYEFLNVHVRLLLAERFYSRHTNHGFDQAFALYLICRVFDLGELSAEGIRKGRERLIDEASFAFDEDGVHVENSPGYHPLMMSRLLQARELLSAYETGPVGFDFEGAYDRALDFVIHATKPDGTFPQFGDTEVQQVRSSFDLTVPTNNEHFQYSISQGRAGTPSPATAKVFQNAGYAFMRSRWDDAENFASSIHVSFKCCFKSTYHRHDDDNNVVLYGFGENWLIESGIYKYEEGEAPRIYLRSTRAHNIATIDGCEVSRSLPGADRRSGIIDWQSNDVVSSVTGRSFIYKGFQYDRTVTFDRNRCLLSLEDKVAPISDKTPSNFEVRFHVPHDKAIQIDGQSVDVISKRSGRRMSLRARRGDFDSLEVATGREEPSYAGWTSPNVGILQQATTIIFQARKRTALNSSFEIIFEADQ